MAGRLDPVFCTKAERVAFACLTQSRPRLMLAGSFDWWAPSSIWPDVIVTDVRCTLERAWNCGLQVQKRFVFLVSYFSPQILVFDTHTNPISPSPIPSTPSQWLLSTVCVSILCLCGRFPIFGGMEVIASRHCGEILQLKHQRQYQSN